MRFSIIVPIYNVDKYLNECIDSILLQSYEDFELILVDDGSTDSSGAICDQYSRTDNRIKVIHKENGGLVSARKAASHIVNGDYILSVDGDDSIGDEYLESISKCIDTYGTDVVAWGFIRKERSEPGGVRNLNRIACGLYEGEALNVIKNSYLSDPETDEINMGSLLYNIVTKAVKRDLYKECQQIVPNGITEGEDAAFTWLLLDRINSLFVIDLDQYYYCYNSRSITSEVHETTVKAQKELEKFLLETADNSEQRLKQVLCFLFYRIIFIIDRAIQGGYTKYKKIVKIGEKEGIFDECVKAPIKNISKGNALRRFLIKSRMWLLLFLYHRARRKKE